jgi:8-oxo-dGTP pyrophosphatase MutT (NUDIX family)
VDEPPIRTVRAVLAYENRYVQVYDDEVVFPSGRAGTYLRIVESRGRPGVVALALAGDRVALVHSYRYPSGAWEWGLPRGFANADDPVASILTELDEELGGRPEEIQPLVRVASNSGLLAGRVQVFLARYAQPVAAPADPDEIHAVRWVPLDRLRAEIAEGLIDDGFTLAALAAADAKGLLP